MVGNLLMAVVVGVLLWLCQWLWRLGCEWERARTVARLVAACEEAYRKNRNAMGPKFSWVMVRLRKRYPRVDYEQLSEDIRAAVWRARGKEKAAG